MTERISPETVDREDDVLDLLRVCFDTKTRDSLTYMQWKDGIDVTRVGSDTMRFVDLIITQFGGHAQQPTADPAIHRIEHDGFEGVMIGSYTTLEGKEGVVLQQIGTRVVHVYGKKWLVPLTDRKPFCIHGLADYNICPDCNPLVTRPDPAPTKKTGE